MEDIRKLVKLGNNSFVVSLPLIWIKKNRLEKGDQIYIKNLGDSVVLKPFRRTTKEEQTRKTLLEFNNSLEIFRAKLYSAYINNYDIIEITKFKKDDVPKIRKEIDRLIALEIVEERSDRIIAKDLLDYQKNSIQKIIAQADSIVKNMFTELRKNDMIVLDEIDLSLNRLLVLAHKILKKHLKGSNIKIQNEGILLFWELIIMIEEIGDILKAIELNLKVMSEKNRKEVNRCILLIEDTYNQLMNAIYHKNKDKAIEVIQKREEIEKIIEKMAKIKDKKIFLLAGYCDVLYHIILTLAFDLMNLE